jgi:hypothetical protein
MTPRKNPTSELSALFNTDASVEMLTAADANTRLAYLLSSTGMRQETVEEIVSKLRGKRESKDTTKVETLGKVLKTLGNS